MTGESCKNAEMAGLCNFHEEDVNLKEQNREQKKKEKKKTKNQKCQCIKVQLLPKSESHKPHQM